MFWVEVACWDEDGRQMPLEPQEVDAVSHKQAAEKLCGGSLVEGDNNGRYAAMVWRKSEIQRQIKYFYRLPN